MLGSSIFLISSPVLFFFFNDPATTEIYTLSLHDALPICQSMEYASHPVSKMDYARYIAASLFYLDRKSTRLNSSHVSISYAVFCLKKKKNNTSRLTISQHVNHIRLHRCRIVSQFTPSPQT